MLCCNTILAFDFGIKNIGVAVGQRVTKTASPLTTLKAQNGMPNWRLISLIISEWKVDEIVVGLPLNMDGTEQFFTKHACNFSYKIRDLFGIETRLYDERMSTIEARSKLFEYGGFRELSNYKINSSAALIILESYLENSY